MPPDSQSKRTLMRPRTRGTDFSFEGKRYRISLDGPWTEERRRMYAVAMAAFAQKQARLVQQFLYFIDCGDRIKIGIARNPHRRLRSLQTGNPGQLRLLAFAPADLRLERAVHVKFESARVQGEWFKKTEELLLFAQRVAVSDRIVIDGDTGDIRPMIRLDGRRSTGARCLPE